MEQKTTLNQLYEKEQNKVLKYFISNIEGQWTKENYKKNLKVPYLDIFITSKCNQKCSYCYLQKYEELYPKDIQNNDKIIKNITLYFDYLLEKECNYLKRLDLFSGEIWGWPLGNAIFDLLLNYLKKGFKIKEIIIPSNCSFCLDDSLLKVIDYYINQFKLYGTNLFFSISMDGYVIDKQSRPFVSKEKTDDYYNRIFKFAKFYDFGFHPMISPDTIHLQKENYDFWVSEMNNHFSDSYKRDYGRIMQLETRESNWTDDKIMLYVDWLNYMSEKDKKIYFNNDDELFLKYLLNERLPEFKEYHFQNPYIPYKFVIDNCATLGCGLGNSLQIRAGDLAIIPCHRTSYDKFIFGYYVLNESEDKINDLKAKNIPLLNAIYKTGFKTKPYCLDCYLNKFCPQYCIGANYENYDDIFYPVTENCHLQKAKYSFICLLYQKLGIKDIKITDMNYKMAVENFIDFLQEQKEIQEWTKRIQQIL